MKCAWTLVVLFLTFPLVAQVSISSYLGAPFTDEEFVYIEAKEDYLNDHRFNSTWLREIDFRLRTQDIVADIDEYRMRFGLINPAEIKANKAFKKLIDAQLATEKETIINDLLKYRYELLIEYHYLLQEKSDLAKQLVFIDQLSDLLAEEDIDIGDLLNIREWKLNVELDQISNRQKHMLIGKTIADIAGAAVAMDDVDWISISRIQESLKTESDSGAYLHLEALHEYELEKQLLKIDRAEAFSNLGFVQAEYDLGRGTSFDEKLGFQFGINIPIVNRDRPDIQRDELNLIKEKVALDQAAKSNSQIEKQLLDELRSSIQKYEMISQYLDELQTIEELAIQETDVSSLYQFLSYQGKLLDKRRKIQNDILNQFIIWLHFKRSLIKEPYQNYLSDTQETFELLE